MASLSHFDDQGASRMVDTSNKEETQRLAKASAIVRMEESTAELIRNKELSKGDVLEVARLAGIQAAKIGGMYAIGVGTPEALPGADRYIRSLKDML